jgi:hypothetical protein
MRTIFLALLWTACSWAWASLPARAQTEVEQQGELRRERDASPQGAGGAAPTISFIDSPSAHCYQPNPAQDVCYVSWQSMYVSAAPNYMIKLTVELDGRRVMNVAGFFQTYLSIDRSSGGPNGYRVACGPPTVADPLLGNSYNYTIRAQDSAMLNAANYGTVTCPPFVN